MFIDIPDAFWRKKKKKKETLAEIVDAGCP